MKVFLDSDIILDFLLKREPFFIEALQLFILKEIELALASDFHDFEDAIQYHTALESKCTFFITRNTKDYKKAKNMRVLTAAQFCKLFVK